MALVMSLKRNGPGFSPSDEGGFADESPNRSAPIPFPMLLLAAALWILNIITLHLGLPWRNFAFTSSYGGVMLFCYFLTGLTTIKALKRAPSWSPLGQRYSGMRSLTGSCSVCDSFRELTGGFSDMPPKVEAVYVEHLSREHGMEP